ncbi:hypothetical protein V490_03216 [Pseudogymnoascus sp. VKM F-3557]|nr:hypothetical protein V490_03216 [Pseudogymnoascus sp. VKM F-3557]
MTSLRKKEAEIRKRTPLCHNCGWNMHLQISAGYVSTVKCFFGHGMRGLWNIGSEYILKELPLIDTWGDDYIGTDAATTKFVRENTTVPVVEEIKYWKDDKSHFFLMKRVPGQSLEDAWPSLSDNEKKGYAREVIGYIAEIRNHTAPAPQTVEGAPVRDKLLGSTHYSVRKIEDKETWWAGVAEGLADSNPAWLEEFKERYPRRTSHYVLTHGDLNIGNIMIHDGHVSGIIDWEHSGYFPDWWEHACALTWMEDPEWQLYILNEMEAQLTTEFGNHRDAADFCRSFKDSYKMPRRKHTPPKERGNFCECKPDF